MAEHRKPRSPEEARRIIADTNGSHALEGIASDPVTDEINYQYLTGAIGDEEKWQKIREKIVREHPGLTEEQIAAIGNIGRD